MIAATDIATEQGAARFRLTYDGEGLDAIDVNDLAPALLGLGEIIDAINAEVTAGTQSIRVRVRAGFQSGSFVIDLELIRATYGKLIELFAGKDLSALDTFLGVLGIAGVPGLIQLFRKSKGQPARRVVEIEQTNRVRVTFEDGQEEEVAKSLWRLFNTPSLRAGFTRLVKPLQAEEIDLLELSTGNGTVERITDDEIGFFSVPSEHEGQLITESERVLRVVSVSFKTGNKWRVTEGGAQYAVSIADPDFIRQVQSGAERFGANDFLRVLLRTAQWTEGGQLKASYTVVRVIEVMRSPGQSSLSFDEGSDVGA